MRSEGTLIQTIGRAARNIRGKAILYADKVTGSMDRAMKETNRRREIQITFNKENKIKPNDMGIKKNGIIFDTPNLSIRNPENKRAKTEEKV